MTELTALWLPILSSAAGVFVASSVIHMALPFHKRDYRRLPAEDVVIDALRDTMVAPGDYMFPGCDSMKDMGSPEMRAKYARGPIGVISVMPGGGLRMGRSLGQWFAFCVVVSVFVAYLTGLAHQPGAPGASTFRFAATIAMLGYSFSNVTNSIWKGVAWTTTFKFVFDGIVYAAVTGAVFSWLWPTA